MSKSSRRPAVGKLIALDDASEGVEHGVSSGASPVTLECCETDVARLLIDAAAAWGVSKATGYATAIEGLEMQDVFVQKRSVIGEDCRSDVAKLTLALRTSASYARLRL